MSYNYGSKPTGNKVLAILAMSFGIAGVLGSALLIWLFQYYVNAVYINALRGYKIYVPDEDAIRTLFWLAIGCSPFAIAGLVLGAIAKGSFPGDSEAKQFAVAGLICGITFLAHAAAAFGLWLLYKLSEVSL